MPHSPDRPVRRHAPTEASPFAVLERAFALLTTGPSPLAVNGTEIAGLPNRPMPLGELRSRLLHPSARYATRDASITVLVSRARAEGGAWTVGLAGVLLPGLRRAVAPLASSCPGKAADLEAEMLVGLLTALDRMPSGRARPAAWLTGRAFDTAKALLRRELAERARPGHDPVSTEPPQPYGHPDLVLARAVAQGVICADDAELIGATRLGDVSLRDTATALGLSYAAAHQRRLRAETALGAWLGHEIRGDFVENPARPAGSKGAGRPRHRDAGPARGRESAHPQPTTTPRR
ncbi:MAG: RNA polymerase sigma factor [Actinomycetes bacterium]